MGVLTDQVVFRPKAPELDEIRAKMEEICGFEVVTIDGTGDGEETDELERLEEMEARLAFACMPEHTLRIYTYRPGAVRQRAQEMMEDDWLVDIVQGSHEPEGSQTVYLRGYVGQELTLIWLTQLALEALGGELSHGIDDEARAKCEHPISVDELRQRHREMASRRRRWVALFWLSLPLQLLVMAVGCLLSMLKMPFDIWRAFRQVENVGRREGSLKNHSDV